MKRITQILALISFLLNGIYLALWIDVFRKFTTHEERLEHFYQYIPGFISAKGLNFFLIALTILAIGLLLAHRRNSLFNIILVVEFLFAAVYIWGLL